MEKKTAMSKTRILYRLIKFSANYKGAIAVLLLLGFIGVGFGVLQPLPMKYIIDNVLSNQPLPENLKIIFSYFGNILDW